MFKLAGFILMALLATGIAQAAGFEYNVNKLDELVILKQHGFIQGFKEGVCR